MNVTAPQSYDVVVAGSGIIGAACALALTQAGLRVALVEREFPGSGATAAGMGHIVVMDDSEAQFALTRRSQLLWQALSAVLPPGAEYETRGTLWIAADDDELAEAERKQAYFNVREVPSRLLSIRELTAMEPNLRPGLAGALLVPEDAVVYPPAVALHLARQAQSLGATLLVGHAITHLADGEARLDDGVRLRAPRLVNATGAEASHCTAGLPVKKRKGHLAITDRYPGFVHHQLVEVGVGLHRIVRDVDAAEVIGYPARPHVVELRLHRGVGRRRDDAELHASAERITGHASSPGRQATALARSSDS